ncbi:MAG: hypothetical protein J5I90_16605 [Caldilineales bacterium]|nr:hypothetical protein [Caldilineales bacterium]
MTDIDLIASYLSAVTEKIESFGPLIANWKIQEEIDMTIGRGFIKGVITFFDGSRLEIVEQLPITRQKYRFHLMDAEQKLIARWDSAPHHTHLSSFPHHKHTSSGVEDHPAVNLLEILDEMILLLHI